MKLPSKTPYAKTPYAKTSIPLINSSHLHYLNNRQECTLKLGLSHKLIYTWLLNAFRLHASRNSKVTLSNDWISDNTDVSTKTVVRVLDDLVKAGVVVMAPRERKQTGTYKVTQYLDVIDIHASARHRLSSDKLKAREKRLRKEKGTKSALTTEQYLIYTKNVQYAIGRGKYLTEEEYSKAYEIDLSGGGIGFKWME